MGVNYLDFSTGNEILEAKQSQDEEEEKQKCVAVIVCGVLVEDQLFRTNICAHK